MMAHKHQELGQQVLADMVLEEASRSGKHVIKLVVQRGSPTPVQVVLEPGNEAVAS
jgi:hypothetical protein